jgi:hypothetical protein
MRRHQTIFMFDYGVCWFWLNASLPFQIDEPKQVGFIVENPSSLVFVKRDAVSSSAATLVS